MKLHFKDRLAWRKWLESHHTTSVEVWIVFARKHTKKATISYDEAVDEALCFGWIDGVVNTVDADHFARRFTPRRKSSIWSKINVARVKRLIAAGEMRAAGLRVVEEAKLAGAFAKAYSVSDDQPMPPELTAALAKHKSARKTFDALTPGQQRQWIRIVLSVKGDRAAKAKEVIALFMAGRKAGETDAQAARRGVASKRDILGA